MSFFKSIENFNRRADSIIANPDDYFEQKAEAARKAAAAPALDLLRRVQGDLAQCTQDLNLKLDAWRSGKVSAQEKFNPSIESKREIISQAKLYKTAIKTLKIGACFFLGAFALPWIILFFGQLGVPGPEYARAQFWAVWPYLYHITITTLPVGLILGAAALITSQVAHSTIKKARVVKNKDFNEFVNKYVMKSSWTEKFIPSEEALMDDQLHALYKSYKAETKSILEDYKAGQYWRRS